MFLIAFHTARTAAISAALVLMAGCSSASLPWADEVQDSSNASAIAIAGLSEPYSPNPKWTNIGSGMGEALRRKLAEQNGNAIRNDPDLIAQVQQSMSGSESARRLKRIHADHPQTRYVISGRVVEFTHHTHRPEDLSKWGPSRNRREAAVAVQLSVVDLQQGRTVIDERFDGHAWANDSSVDQTYRGVSFGSHRFWDTPLGLASKDAIEQAANRINELAPPPVAQTPIRIVKLITDRRVRLSSDSSSQVKPGELMNVCVYDAGGTKLKPVIDPTTNKPLQARIESRGLYPSAWLMGPPPSGINLSQAVLRAAKP